MLLDLSKGRKILFYIAAILVGFCGMAEMGVNPAIVGVFETYGYELAGNVAVSIPTATMAIASFACAALMSRITKKKLIIVGVAIFAIGGCTAGMLASNYGLYVLMRGLMGVGEGVTNTVILAYLAQMYIDEQKHATFIGIWNVFYTLFGMILSVCGGIFAVPDWTNLFVVFLPSIVVLVVVIVFLPELGMETEPKGIAAPAAAKEIVAEAKAKKGMGGLFWTFWLSFMIYSLSVALYFYFFSDYVVETGIGSYDVAGFMMMVMTGGGLVVSFFFGKVFMALKRWLSILDTAIMVIALAICFFFQGNMVMGYVASFLMGVSFGWQYTYMYTMVTEVTDAENVDKGIGFITGGYSVMYFIVSYIVNFLRPIISPDQFNEMTFAPPVAPVFLVFAIVCVIPLIIEFVTFPAYRKRVKENEAAEAAAEEGPAA